MTALLARLPAARLARTPRTIALALSWFAIAIVFAIVGRRLDFGRADAALIVGFAEIAMPLLVFVVVGGALGGHDLVRSGRSLTALGAEPARVALTSIVVAAAASTIVCASLAAIVAVIAHGAGDPPIARDALLSAYAGALGGLAYTAYFALGSAFASRAVGRSLFLVADFLIGSTGGVFALITPRAHVASLLGASGPLGISGRASSIALVALTLVFGGLAVLRAHRAR